MFPCDIHKLRTPGWGRASSRLPTSVNVALVVFLTFRSLQGLAQTPCSHYFADLSKTFQSSPEHVIDPEVVSRIVRLQQGFTSLQKRNLLTGRHLTQHLEESGAALSKAFSDIETRVVTGEHGQSELHISLKTGSSGVSKLGRILGKLRENHSGSINAIVYDPYRLNQASSFSHRTRRLSVNLPDFESDHDI